MKLHKLRLINTRTLLNIALLYGLSGLLTLLYLCFWQGTLNFIYFGIVLMWLPGILALFFAKKEGIRIPILAKPSLRFLTTALRALFLAFCIALVSLPFAQYSGFEQIRYALPSFMHTLSPLYFLPLAALYFSVVALLCGLSVNMLTALGEEIMWRGYLWEKFKHLGLMKGALAIGFLWGVWHAPLVVLLGLNYPETHAFLAVVMMILFCMALSPILCFYRAKGLPTLYPAIFHGTLNAIAGATILLFNEPNLFWVSLPGVTGIIVLALFSTFDIIRAKKLDRSCASES